MTISTNRLALSKLLAFTKRGFLQASSYRLNFVGTYLGGVLSVIFFSVLAQFYGFAAGQARPLPEALAPYGGDYFTFLLIGGAFARFLSLGLRHFGRELEHEMTAGTVEPLLVTATSPALALLGASLWVLVEGVLLLVMQLAVGGLFFGADFTRADWPAALSLTLLTLLALGSWGLITAAFMLVFKRADPLSWLVDVTLFMLAGVYFPVSILPPALRFIAYLLPLSHALEGLRLALMRGQTLLQLWPSVLILIGFNLLLLPAGVLALRFAIRHVKRSGSLGQY